MNVEKALPGYWMHETSGVLRPAIVAYLKRDPMTPEQIAAMRAYLRQWINGDWGPEDEVAQLRHDIDGLTSRSAIDRWLEAAVAIGIDPL